MQTLEMISLLLKQKNKTQKELMTYLGKSQNIYTDWLGGRNKSYKKYINDIAEFLEVNPLVLLLPDKYDDLKSSLLKKPNDTLLSDSEIEDKMLLKFKLLHDDQQQQVKDFIDFLYNQNIVNSNKEGK